MHVLRRMSKLLHEHDPKDTALPAWGPSFVSSVIRWEDDKIDPARGDDDYIHVSQLVHDWCPREYVLRKRHGIQANGESVTGGHRVMWAVGRAVEKHVRTQFIKGVNYHGVWGVWSCNCGKKTVTGFADRTKVCSICHTPALHYNEYRLLDDSDYVSGSPDLIFVRRGKVYPVEIKSITDSESANSRGIGFTSLARPYGDHLFQVFTYWLKIERLLLPQLNKASMGSGVIMLYTTKDFKYGSPYKEFHERVQDYQWLIDGTIKPALRGAKRAWQAGRDDKKPLPAKVCPNITCPRAKGCPCAVECFQQR